MNRLTFFVLGIPAAAALVLVAPQARASTASADSLSSELQSLELPANQPPVSLSQEKLYAVQTRYSPLRHRSEFDLDLTRALAGDSMLTTQEVGLDYRFHLSDRFSLNLGASKVFNSLSPAGKRLLAQEGLLPDSSFAKYRADIGATFNVFYGKFRLSMERTFYFDQYVSLGGGIVGLQSKSQGAATADVGFAFWLGRSGVIRVGVRDWLYREQRTQSSGITNLISGHLDVGYLLGGGNS